MRLFISIIVFSLLLQPISAQQKAAQLPAPHADTSYHILWFKGKKIRPNVLLKTNYDTVFYTPAKGLLRVVSKGGTGRQYDKMMLELDRTPQRMNEMMQTIAKALPKSASPYFAVPLKSAYERVQNDLSGALANKLELPGLSEFTSSTASQPPAPQPGSEDKPVAAPANATYKAAAPSGTNAVEEFFKKVNVNNLKDVSLVKEVLDYYEKHKNEAITYVPAPPRNEYTYCSECDTAAESRYQRELDVFQDDVMGKDAYIMRLMLGIWRESELGFPAELRAEVSRLFEPIMDWLFDRTDKRIRLLVEKYIDDPSRVRTVTMIALTFERRRQLMGTANTDYYIEAFLRGQRTLANMIKKAIQEYDYSIALNVNLILGVERQFQLTGGSEMQVFDMLGFNQFKMHVDVSAKIQGEGGYQLAHVRGDNWFAAVPDKNCRLQWVLLGPDKDKLKVKLLAAELRGAIDIPYVGTKNFEATKPRMRIDFCGPEQKDTIEAYNFHGEGSDERWMYPPPMGTVRSANMHTVLVGCFIDMKRAYEKASQFKNPENVEKMKQQMMQQYQQFMKSGGGAAMAKNAANMNAQDVQKMMQMAQTMDAAKQMEQLIHMPDIASYLVLPTVNNRQKLILKERLDGKQIFPQNAATVYAWFNITLEQDPNSPYKFEDLILPKR